jgi:hypothetical protein
MKNQSLRPGPNRTYSGNAYNGGMNQGLILLARKRASDLDKPDWSQQKPSDWQHYIPEQIRVAWPTLAEECRAVAFLVAEAAVAAAVRPKR